MTSDARLSVVAEAISHARANGVEVTDSYKITTVVLHSEKGPEVNTYTIPTAELDQFFDEYYVTGEIVVNIEPCD